MDTPQDFNEAIRQGTLSNKDLLDLIRSYNGKKVGVLSGGGDAPGANAVLTGIMERGGELGYIIVGFEDGYKQLVSDIPYVQILKYDPTNNIMKEGGVIIHSSRTNPFKVIYNKDGDLVEDKTYAVNADNPDDRSQKLVDNLDGLGIERLIGIGGDDTLGALNRLHKEKGINTIGITKSIDDDYGEGYTFGRDTAVNRGVEVVDSLRTTAGSHKRDIIVEVMGRKGGMIAYEVALATDADVLLLPEFKFDMEQVYLICSQNRKDGALYNIIVASEGAEPTQGTEFLQDDRYEDAFGHNKLGGIGKAIEAYLNERYGDAKARAMVVGHLHRAGIPTRTDRTRGRMYGFGAMNLINAGESGKIITYKDGKYITLPLDTVTKKKRVTSHVYDPKKLNVRTDKVGIEEVIPHYSS